MSATGLLLSNRKGLMVKGRLFAWVGEKGQFGVLGNAGDGKRLPSMDF